MRRAAALLLALLLAFAPAVAVAQAHPPPDALVVPAGSTYRGDLAVLGRSVVIAGAVAGDVTSWSGDIFVYGGVGGDVVSYAGQIVLGPGAQVRGNVMALGGGVAQEGVASVSGQLLGEQPIAGGAIAASVVGIFAGQPDTPADLPQPLVSLALGLVAALLSLACAVVWPRRIEGVSRAIRSAPGRAALLGLLSTLILALLALPAGALIAMSLVGLPLLLPLLLLLHGPYLFGFAGLARALAARLGPGWPAPAATTAAALALLAPLVAIGAFAPAWSAALFYLLAGVGLGAAILSRGGAYLVAAQTPRR